jgi:hypothetical protein
LVFELSLNFGVWSLKFLKNPGRSRALFLLPSPGDWQPFRVGISLRQFKQVKERLELCMMLLVMPGGIVRLGRFVPPPDASLGGGDGARGKDEL